MMKKAEALKTYGEAAMMQMVVERLPDIARAFAEPLASGVNRFVGNVGGGMAAMAEFLKSNFDIDVAEMIKSGAGAGSIKKTDSTARIEEVPPASPPAPGKPRGTT
ncbi:MAG: hypothetical protein SGI90_11610 [Candidatus Eisenbacteria bacterium]|nr:hypothetical protein [Candidatus Eisenbacteria bacterium]